MSNLIFQPKQDPDDLYETFNKGLYRLDSSDQSSSDMMAQLSADQNANNSQSLTVSASDIGSGVDTATTQAATGSYQAGKRDFTNVDNGFIIGVDPKDGKAKFYLGNSSNYFNYNGSSLVLSSSSGNAVVIDFGSSVLLQNGGNIDFTSVTAPGSFTLAPITTAGNLNDSGRDYHYAITFVTANGETNETDAQVVTPTVGQQQMLISGIPVSSSASVTKRRIYRTPSIFHNDPVFTSWYLLTTINDNTTTTYTDNTADATLTAGTPAFFNFQNANSSAGRIRVDNVPILSSSTSNTFVGQHAGETINAGYQNVGLGAYSLEFLTNGYYNTGVGHYALNNVTTGFYNTALGEESLRILTTGSENTALGVFAQFSATSAVKNVSVGNHSLENVTTGSSNVAIGWYAGKYATTTSDELFVNNRDRSNYAGDKSSSLLYGVFSALSSGQKLTINGLFNLSVSLTPASAAATGTQGDIAWDSSFIYVCVAANTWKRVGIATW